MRLFPFIAALGFSLSLAWAEPASQPRPPGILGVVLTDTTIARVAPGSPAEKAGLRSGDRILQMGDRQIDNRDAVTAVLSLKSAGDTIELVYERDGATHKTALVLAAAPAAASTTPTTRVAGPAWVRGRGAEPEQQPLVTLIQLPQAARSGGIRGVSFIDALNGWIVGDKGLCLRTSDGGANWTRLDLGSGATLRAVRFNSDGEGWICGDSDPDAPPARGHVLTDRPVNAAQLLHTRDGGANWESVWMPTNFNVPAMAATAQGAVLGSFGGDAHSDGSTFVYGADLNLQKRQRAFRGLLGMAMQGERVIGVGSAVSVGFFPPPQTPLFAQKNCRAIWSADGGQTWEPSAASGGRGKLRAVIFISQKVAVAVGDNGEVCRSADSGETWEQVRSPTQENLLALASGDSGLLAVGGKGVAVVSRDAGKTWEAIAPETKDNLISASGGGKFFYVTSAQGTLLRLRVPGNP